MQLENKTDPLFDYPFTKRRSLGNINDFWIPEQGGYYTYNHETLFFDRTEACHIEGINDQLKYFVWWANQANETNPESYLGDSMCNRNHFKKVKYSRLTDVLKTHTDSADQLLLPIRLVSMENG